MDTLADPFNREESILPGRVGGLQTSSSVAAVRAGPRIGPRKVGKERSTSVVMGNWWLRDPLNDTVTL